MGRRWARSKERGPSGQLALAFCGAQTLRESPRIETDHVALGPVDTSREAAAVAEHDADFVRRLILDCVRGSGARGLTLDEFCVATGKPANRVSGRFTDLRKLGLIQRSGERRTTKTGATAHVWVAVLR